MKDLKEMSKKELIHEWNSINQIIEQVGCFGVKDLMWRGAIENELERRGYEVEIETTSRLKINQTTKG